MKQYLPLKPTKRGFKVWVVAESSTGYFLDLQVYVGKETEATEHGLGESGPSADRAVSQEKPPVFLRQLFLLPSSLQSAT